MLVTVMQEVPPFEGVMREMPRSGYACPLVMHCRCITPDATNSTINKGIYSEVMKL